MLIEERRKSEKPLKKCADVDYKIYGVVSMKFWTWQESINRSLRKKVNTSCSKNNSDTIVNMNCHVILNLQLSIALMWMFTGANYRVSLIIPEDKPVDIVVPPLLVRNQNLVNPVKEKKHSVQRDTFNNRRVSTETFLASLQKHNN